MQPMPYILMVSIKQMLLVRAHKSSVMHFGFYGASESFGGFFYFITILSSSFFVFILCQKMPKVIVYSIVIIRWTKLYDSSSATHYTGNALFLLSYVGT